MGVVGGLASPAGADPARPTNYRSEVTRLDPPTDAVAVDVIGGDAFLRIRVERGHEATVLGYSGEPYVRILADGTVEQNERSPAVRLNTDRYARVGSQDDLTDEEIRAMEPDWRRVGGDGTFVWHDHNSHWMSTALPPQLEGRQSGVVFEDWVVPIEVDGVATNVHGMLHRDAPPSTLPWLALAAVVAVVIGFVALRPNVKGRAGTESDRGRFEFDERRAVMVVAIALVAVGLAAFAISAVGQFGLPASTGRQYHLVIVPAIAVAATVAGIVLRRTPSGRALVAGGALSLPIWIFGTYGVLSHSHAPTDVAVGLQRTVIALAIGAAAVGVAVTVLAFVREARPTAPD